ncbi:MAG: hypothetical protein ACP5GX_11515, partial [Anaerolineae bacterium]
MKTKSFVVLGITLVALALVAVLQMGMQNAAAAVGPEQETLNLQSFEIEKSVVEPPSGVAVVSDTVVFEVVITNIADTPLDTHMLQDHYITPCLTYMGATPPPDEVYTGLGDLFWYTLGVIEPGMSTTVVISFHAATPCEVVTNTAIMLEWGVDAEAVITILPEGEADGDLGDAPDSTNHFGVPMTAYPAGG